MCSSKEKVTVPAGTYDCVVVEPMLNETEGIFRQSGRIWIYMTDDSQAHAGKDDQ